MIGHVLVSADEVITNDYSSSHDALDLVGAGNSISDVIALEDGVVELVISDVTATDLNSSGTASYGNFVKIRHANGQKTLYAHLKYGSVTVQDGDYVSKGEKIGTMGATGRAYGVHLHFEVRNSDETRVNPYEYLWGTKQIRAPAVSQNIEIIDIQDVEETVNDDSSFNDAKAEDISLQSESIIKNKEEIKKVSKEILANKSVKENISNKEKVSNKENIILLPKNTKKYLINDSYCWYSIVDALKEIAVDSSYANRSLIAEKNGIENYRGTAQQNLKMLDLLKTGKLLNI